MGYISVYKYLNVKLQKSQVTVHSNVWKAEFLLSPVTGYRAGSLSCAWSLFLSRFPHLPHAFLKSAGLHTCISNCCLSLNCKTEPRRRKTERKKERKHFISDKSNSLIKYSEERPCRNVFLTHRMLKQTSQWQRENDSGKLSVQIMHQAFSWQERYRTRCRLWISSSGMPAQKEW